MSHRFKSINENVEPIWKAFELKWKQEFGKAPTIESIIFLVGIQESGILKDDYSKEEKKDIMHVGVCSLLKQEGYFELDYIDKDNWPHFKKTKNFEQLNLEDQENILMNNILAYFKKNEWQ